MELIRQPDMHILTGVDGVMGRSNSDGSEQHAAVQHAAVQQAAAHARRVRAEAGLQPLRAARADMSGLDRDEPRC